MTRRDNKRRRPQDDQAPAIWTALAVVGVLLWAAALVLIVTIHPARAHAREAPPPEATQAEDPAGPRALS